ncbi:hypothetical protein FRB90_002524, partial [Tulasnella sp. 427]
MSRPSIQGTRDDRTIQTQGGSLSRTRNGESPADPRSGATSGSGVDSSAATAVASPRSRSSFQTLKDFVENLNPAPSLENSG